MFYNMMGDTGIKVSHISIGGAAFSNIYGQKKRSRKTRVYGDQRSVELIRGSIDFGVNYFETGPWYGQGSSEIAYGKALQGIPRTSYYIASKVGRYGTSASNMFDFSEEKTTAAVDNTLELLGLDYVDFMQIHDITFAPDMSVILHETLPALQRAVHQGKVRFIGLCDYDIGLMKDIFEESEIKISSILSYAKCTMFDNRLQNYAKFFRNHGCAVINASITGMGLLTNNGPMSWHPASAEVKAVCRQAAEYCKERKVELARLANWYTLNQPNIDTNVCGAFNLQQLYDTMNVLTQGLTDLEMVVLKDVQERFFQNSVLNWDNVELPVYMAQLNESTAI